MFVTPLGPVRTSSGSAETIARFCLAWARRLSETTEDPREASAARALATFLDDLIVTTMCGFDVSAAPLLDQAEARAVLLQCLAALMRSVRDGEPTWSFITTTPLLAYWLSNTRRLHDGLASVVPGAAPLALDLPPKLEKACAAYLVLDERRPRRGARVRGEAADPRRQAHLTRSALELVRAAGDAFDPKLVEDLLADLTALEALDG